MCHSNFNVGCPFTSPTSKQNKKNVKQGVTCYTARCLPNIRDEHVLRVLDAYKTKFDKLGMPTTVRNE